MKSSYLIPDEYMRFLDKERDSASPSILDVGVSDAISKISWDEKSFFDRGGFYDWGREAGKASKACGKSVAAELDFWSP